MTKAQPTQRILVIEDDADMSFAITRHLGRHGYLVSAAHDGEAGLQLSRQDPPSLVVLDIMLPRVDGFRVLRTLRAEGNQVPVILLTARAAAPDKLFGFRLGADDYVTKPFGLDELLARIQAVLRRTATHRASSPPSRMLCCGDVVIDLETRSVTKAGRSVTLSPRTYELLVALATSSGATVARRHLMRSVWGYGDEVVSRTLDTHVADLRRKLEDDPRHPKYIVTVWRVGYRLADLQP